MSNNNPFNPYPSKSSSLVDQDNLAKLFELLASKEKSSQSSPSQQAWANLQKLAISGHDQALLNELKRFTTWDGLSSSRLGALLEAMVKNSGIQKSLVFLTSQAHKAWDDKGQLNKDVIECLGRGLNTASLERQEEVYALLFHDFSVLGSHAHSVLFRMLSGTMEGACVLLSLIPEKNIAWPKSLDTLSPKAVAFVDQNFERFSLRKDAFEEMAVACLFDHAQHLDFGAGTTWVTQVLHTMEETRRGELLFRHWRRRAGEEFTDTHLKVLEAFLTQEDMTHLTLSYLKAKQPVLSNRVAPLIERSLLSEAVSSVKPGNNGRKM